MLDALPPAPPGETIVITARALPDPEAERAFSVQTIDRTQLGNGPSSQTDNVLQQVAGLQFFRRSDARSSHPTSQGVTFRALGGNASSRALLMLDGVPQSDPFGGWINWPAYDPASLEQVRIVRGGGSVGSGPGALAGVIAMTSRLEQALEGSAFLGSRDSLEGRIHAGQPIGSGALALSARAARGDGFIPVTRETRGPADRPAPYREASLRALWRTPLSDGIDVQLSGMAFTDRRERGVAFTGNRTDGADAAIRLVGSGEMRWSGTAYVQARDLRSSFASVSPGRTEAMRVALQDEVPSHAVGGNLELRPALGAGMELRLGGDLRATEGESREFFLFQPGEPTRRRAAGGRSFTGGAFAELTGSIGRLTLSGGGRLDHWRIAGGRLQERVIAGGELLRDDSFDDRDGWLPTARAGAVLGAGEGFSLRSAAYLGWRMPTLNELFRPFRAGPDATAANPFLDPERLAGLEAGADYRRGGFALSATLFANRLSDAIANVTLGEGPGLFPGVGFVGAGGEYRQRQNLRAIRVRGLEASAEARTGAWTLRGGASFTDAQVEAGGAASRLDGLRPAQTPSLVLTGGVGWERLGRAASVLIRHGGAQFEDDLNERSLPSATTLDAFAAWPLGREIQLIARGENLLDERVVTGIGGDGSIERATPRTLWLGLRFSRSAEPGRR